MLVKYHSEFIRNFFKVFKQQYLCVNAKKINNKNQRMYQQKTEMISDGSENVTKKRVVNLQLFNKNLFLM